MARVGELKIVTGTANPALALRICDHLGCKLSPALVDTFSDGEIRIEMSDNVRGDDVYVVQPTCAPVNHNLMELCLMLDALKRASAGRVTAVVPYFGYTRQVVVATGLESHVGEVAAPIARGEYGPAAFQAAVQDHDAGAPLGCGGGGHEARRTPANDGDVNGRIWTGRK